MHKTFFLLLAAALSKETTTRYVDNIEPLLRENRDIYLGGPHTAARQQAALYYFDQWWAWLQSSASCGNGLLADAGSRCVTDRQRTGPWPWEVYYRDPIVTGSLLPVPVSPPSR